jgi:hypothetical protein
VDGVGIIDKVGMDGGREDKKCLHRGMRIGGIGRWR